MYQRALWDDAVSLLLILSNAVRAVDLPASLLTQALHPHTAAAEEEPITPRPSPQREVPVGFLPWQ